MPFSVLADGLAFRSNSFRSSSGRGRSSWSRYRSHSASYDARKRSDYFHPPRAFQQASVRGMRSRSRARRSAFGYLFWVQISSHLGKDSVPHRQSSKILLWLLLRPHVRAIGLSMFSSRGSGSCGIQREHLLRGLLLQSWSICLRNKLWIKRFNNSYVN